MIEEETRKFIRCDMCGVEIMSAAHPISLKGYEWDLCQHCDSKIKDVLPFLTINVGLHIEYIHRDAISEVKLLAKREGK